MANSSTNLGPAALSSDIPSNKKVNINREKVFEKCLKLYSFRFLGVLITMHYVRTLCDKYLLSYDGLFFLIF